MSDPPTPPELDVPLAQRPRHIAIIMDGNGRWAESHGLPRVAGHRAGADRVRPLLRECGRLGIEVLTLYSFSSENWKRPEPEVTALMGLCVEYLAAHRAELIEENVRFRQIGRREELPPAVQHAIEATTEATQDCTGTTLVLALNYGGRAEITDAAQAIARKVQQGTIDPAAIDEAMFAEHLSTAGLPDPDLLIRTAGEYRVSNYLLWQISYAELYVTDLGWPDFGLDALHEAIRVYAGRGRRYGAIETS